MRYVTSQEPQYSSKRKNVYVTQNAYSQKQGLSAGTSPSDLLHPQQFVVNYADKLKHNKSVGNVAQLKQKEAKLMRDGLTPQ